MPAILCGEHWTDKTMKPAAAIVDDLLEAAPRRRAKTPPGQPAQPDAPQQEVDPTDYVHQGYEPDVFLARLKQKLEDDYSVANEPDVKYVKNVLDRAQRSQKVPDVDAAAANWAEIDELIDEHGDWVLAIADTYWFDSEDTKQSIRERYRGTFDDAAAFARDYSENMGEIPGWVEPYIDWERMGNAMLQDFEVIEHGGQIVVLHH